MESPGSQSQASVSTMPAIGSAPLQPEWRLLGAHGNDQWVESELGTRELDDQWFLPGTSGKPSGIDRDLVDRWTRTWPRTEIRI
jgi:hypothetical protein